MKTSSYLLLFLFVLPRFLFAQTHDLKFFQDEAKKNSPLINQTKNESKLLQLDLEQIKRMLYKPEISLEGSVLLAPIISHDNGSNRFELVSKGATDYLGYDMAGTDGGQYQAIVSIKQNLLSGSKFRSYTNQNEVAQQSNENKLDLSIHELEQLVRYQYILCLKSQRQSVNSLELLEAMKAQIKNMQLLVEHAIYKQTDLLLLKLEYQSYQLEYETLKAEYAGNLADMNLLCGISDTTKFSISDLELELPIQQPGSSSFLARYRLDSLNVIANQTLNELQYQPRLDAFANAGLNAVYLPAFNRLGMSTGLQFSWLISDGKQRDLQREKAKIQIESISFEKKNFEIQQGLNQQKILNQMNLLDQRIGLIQEQIGQYESLYKMYEKEIARGDLSVMELKSLLKEMAARKQEVLVLQMEKQSLISSFIYWNY